MAAPVLLALLAPLRWSSTLLAAPQPAVDFSRDIRPILSDRCFACHGPDEQARKAKLRLDVRAEAIKKAIVPGDAAKSPLFQRITSQDEDELMPPPESKKQRLTPEQIQRVRAGGKFKGLLITGGKNTEDRILYFDNAAVFTEKFPPLSFEPGSVL